MTEVRVREARFPGAFRPLIRITRALEVVERFRCTPGKRVTEHDRGRQFAPGRRHGFVCLSRFNPVAEELLALPDA